MRGRIVALAAVAVWTLVTGGDVARAEPKSAFDDGADPHASCPYDFHSDVPAGVFCVYEGIAVEPDGQPCTERLVVIWSGGSGDGLKANDVYVGFIDDPDLVVHARSAGSVGNAASVVESFVGDAKQPLSGAAQLHSEDGRDGAILTLALQEPLAGPSCRVASYRGAFMGVIGKPAEVSAQRSL